MVVAKVWVAVVAVVKKMVEQAVVAKVAMTAVAKWWWRSVDARVGARGDGAPAPGTCRTGKCHCRAGCIAPRRP